MRANSVRHRLGLRKSYDVTTAVGLKISQTWAWRARALAFVLTLYATYLHAEVAPAAIELTVDEAFTGKCQLNGPGGSVDGGSSRADSLTLLYRKALPLTGWYWGWGIQAENYSFGGSSTKSKRVQDCAGLFSVEYYQGSEKAASLTLRPGWYFEGHAVMAAWDLPVDLVIGIPIAGPVSGVVGFSNARFYHHALPIAGVVWTMNPRLRLELVYPEPALVVPIGATGSLRLGGELTGTGFLADSRPERTAVDFASYRVGAEGSGEVLPGLRLVLGAGVEIERSFDYFALNKRLHGSGARYARISVVISR